MLGRLEEPDGGKCVSVEREECASGTASDIEERLSRKLWFSTTEEFRSILFDARISLICETLVIVTADSSLVST